jgi:hypothetical protein
MKKNYWIVERKNCFARWYVSFPGEPMCDPYRMLAFLKEVLAAGEREQVFRVVETREPNSFKVSPGWTYSQFLEKMLVEQGRLVFFEQLRAASPWRAEDGADLTPAKICYYDLDGELTEAEVDDLGALLERLRPGDPTDPHWSYHRRNHMASSNPIVLSGQLGYKRYDGESDPSNLATPYLGIKLETDIWFPKVVGFIDGELDWYDNSELANCHTPRFNRFFATVKELAFELGGQWEMEDSDIVRSYLPMLSLDGIILDV